MKDRKAAIVIIAVVLVLLIVGGLYYRSAEKQKQMEAEKKAAELARAEAEKKAELERLKPAEPEAPEIPPVPEPEEVIPEEEPEPVVETPPPPPITTADCKPEPKRIAQKNRLAAPEGMVYVPGGAFVMGSQENAGSANESPAHEVCLSGFYIDKYEVTNAQFQKFVEATGYVTEAESNPAGTVGRSWKQPFGPESNSADIPDHPVIYVSWNDANAYAEWAGKRLPTEAEWEKAARGTDSRTYPWGNSEPTGASANIADKSANLRWSDSSIDDKNKTTAPVGSYPNGKSVYGAEDMAGNVWEWCLDWWSGDYYKESPAQNPTGPQTGEFRVIRGGSWFYSAAGTRAAHRIYFRPASKSTAIGFRCVKDVG